MSFLKQNLIALATSILLLAMGAAHAQPASDHWAFQRPIQHPPPEISDLSWPTGAIDHFVLAGLDRNGYSPAPDADRYTMIRRLSLDLIGLPPTLAEVEAFVQDQQFPAR